MDKLAITRELFDIIGVPLVLALAGLILRQLREHGYRTALADAIVRAAGAANVAASQKGLSLSTVAGRAVGFEAAIAYLRRTVPDPIAYFDFGDPQLVDRVSAQMGATPILPALVLPAPNLPLPPAPPPPTAVAPGSASATKTTTFTYTPGDGVFPSQGGRVTSSTDGPSNP